MAEGCARWRGKGRKKVVLSGSTVGEATRTRLFGKSFPPPTWPRLLHNFFATHAPVRLGPVAQTRRRPYRRPWTSVVARNAFGAFLSHRLGRLLLTHFSSLNMENTTFPKHLFLLRYGLRECPLVEFKGPFNMDLAELGVAQARLSAARVQELARASGAVRPRLVCSPFLRATRTAAQGITPPHTQLGSFGKLTNSQNSQHSRKVSLVLDTPVNVDESVTEWLTPSLVGEERPAAPTWTRAALVDLVDGREDLVGETSAAGPVRAKFPESEEQLFARMQAAIDVLAARDDADAIIVVSHAPCCLAAAVALEGRGAADSTIAPMALGGLFHFARSAPDAPWEMRLAGDTSHMDESAREGIQRWTLPSLERPS